MPLLRGDTGDRRVLEDTTLEERHDVEGGADHGVVFAEAQCAGDRDVGLGHGGDDVVFAVDLVGGAGDDLAGRFLTPGGVLAGGFDGLFEGLRV